MIRTIAQRYQIQEELGSGGMGQVFHGIDLQNQQPVANKQLHSHLTDPQLIERFKREGEALRELNHPNIVKMLDSVEEDGRHYLIMEHVAGLDLAEYMQNGPVPLKRTLDIAIDQIGSPRFLSKKG